MAITPLPSRRGASSPPDWERWEADLAERRPVPRRSDPPLPPQPPVGDGGGPGRGGGGDDGGRGLRVNVAWLTLLVGAVAMMAAVTVLALSQGGKHREPILSPVPPVAASEAPQDAGSR